MWQCLYLDVQWRSLFKIYSNTCSCTIILFSKLLITSHKFIPYVNKNWYFHVISMYVPSVEFPKSLTPHFQIKHFLFHFCIAKTIISLFNRTFCHSCLQFNKAQSSFKIFWYSCTLLELFNDLGLFFWVHNLLLK